MRDERSDKGRPRYIKLDGSDNVAIVVNEGGLDVGARFDDGLVLTEAVPQGHKVALRDIARGESILRYGQIIGKAVRALPRGSWVEESAVSLPIPPDLDRLPKPTLPLPALAPDERLAKMTFDAFVNADGSVGSKNMLALVPSVQCAAGVLLGAVERIERELLPRFPNVDGVVALNHAYGCGVAIDAPNSEIPIRTIRNLASHPNFGGEALVVGLGCEKLQPERIAPPDAAADILRLQEVQGYSAAIGAIMRLAEKRLERLNARKREAVPISRLVVGLQCGGSDAFSGVTANPAIGFAADLLVRAGATVLFSEVTEVRDAVHLLSPRAADMETYSALVREMRWYDEYLDRGGADRSANPAPGNKKGGLANVVEKSLGSIAKSGSSPLSGVLSPGEKATGKGLIFAATPASDFVCGTLQLASGMHLQVFSTGRGTPYGLAAAPVIKVGTRTALAKQWPDLIDVDAGRIASGEATIEEVGWEIFNLIIETASGRKTIWADKHGIRNDLALFNPAPIT